MIVKFWGTRGVTPVPGPATQIYGGNTPCVEVRTEKAIFVCDAGSGLRLLAEDLGKRGGNLPVHVFISHLHAAHVQGLPFLEAGESVTVYCEAKDAAVLKGALGSDLLLRSGRSGALKIVELSEEAVEIQGVKVRSFVLNHPGGCRGFSFEAEGKKVVYVGDNELAIQSGDAFPDPKHQALLMRQMPRPLLQAANAASLLIMDAQFDDAGYAARKGAGHSSCVSVTDFALQAHAEQLALFHHDPASSDDELEERARRCAERAVKFGAKLTIFPAREGMALKL